MELSQRRARQLTRKVAQSPLLPILGITKVVETVVPDTTLGWGGYALVVTLLWVFAADVKDAAEEVTE